MSDIGQTNTAASSAETIVPSPPRLTGDYQSDSVTLADYLQDFYNAAVLQSGLLDPAFQAKVPTIDPAALPDPTATNIAGAQLVANLAYQFAQDINKQLGVAGITGFPLTEPTTET